MELALYDKEFLLKLDQYPHRKTYCKIVALNWDEDPVAEITSNVVSGSIKIDGSSAVRRTASLSLVTNNLKIDTIVWRAQTKIRIFIGLENKVDKKYDDIIWFPQGLFIITSFNSSLSTSGCTISISAKDKMCLLNGDISGQLWASHDFSQVYTTQEDETVVKTYIPIKEIIREAIHTYALEPYSNIIINDLDECGVELLEYIGTNATMYIFKQKTNNSNVWNYQIAFNITSSQSLIDSLNQAIDNNNGIDEGAVYNGSGFTYVVQKRINSTSVDKVAGYRATDLTYPGELVIPVGGTINDLLKKIVTLLGEFEYFYDLEGRFVFQRKKIYYNTKWTNIVMYENTTYYDSMETATDLQYDFAHGILVNSFSNSPQLNTIKNDFSIWGSRKSASGNDINIHLRYAIDHKPTFYYSLLDKKIYATTAINDNGQPYDWRELIYQMAKDNLYAETAITSLKLALSQGYYHYNVDDDQLRWSDKPFYKYDVNTKRFVSIKTESEFNNCKAHKILLFGTNTNKVVKRLTTDQINNLSNILGYSYISYQRGIYEKPTSNEIRNIVNALAAEYLNGNIGPNDLINEIKEWQQTYNTGYEAYYTDILGFWRYMYKIEPDFTTSDNYYTSLGYWLENSSTNSDGSTIVTYINENGKKIEVYYGSDEIDYKTWQDWQKNEYWNPNLFHCDITGNVTVKEPTALYFWLDFCDPDEELAQYGVDVIGRRSKYVNDKDVKAIYFRETPSLVFVNSEYEPVEGEENLNYCKINIAPPISNYFKISTQGKSAKEALDALLYENTLGQESITIQTIPIYYLEPNKRIRVFDENTNINGEYIVKSISIPLNHDGFMSITASRAVERIL